MPQNRPNPKFDKLYLGDGAYVTYDGFNVWITVFDGTATTEKVCLEPEVLKRFLAFLKEHKLP